jgi:hypothetical protein
MDKRYQVFISSTYADLKEERRYVMQALMEMNCIPAGMELFPAADEEQWEFIKKIIDECDYYLLILAGRYGSMTSDGISYTEKEFDYAVQKGLKTICLIHKNPTDIPLKNSEDDPELRKKLNAFCEKAKQGRMVSFWEKPEELKSSAILGLVNAIKKYPAIGFVRADLVPEESSVAEILKLRNKVSELETQIKQISTTAPAGTEEFAQGDDLFEIHFSYKVSNPSSIFDIPGLNNDAKLYRTKFEISWNYIFSCIAPLMVNEASEEILEKQLNALITSYNISDLSSRKEYKEKVLSNFTIYNDIFYKIIIQLKSLGLIIKSTKNRSVKDTGTYWTLTPYGDIVMTRLIAIKKDKK